MQGCKCVGLETVTWRCNWGCVHCYFRRMPQLHKAIDTPIGILKHEIDAGKARGCTEVVLCGKGEPTLHPQITEIISYAAGLGMKPLIITNGTASIDVFNALYDCGLHHLQVSMHGCSSTLDKIAERKGAGVKQRKLLNWLYTNKKLFRVNFTIQQLNYKKMLSTVKVAVEHGAFHVSLLNFLPHYHPGEKIAEIGVRPSDLVEPIQKTIDYMEGKTLITLRYFPMCLLEPRYWKYVTNSLFVPFDPWEWEYGNAGKNLDALWGIGRESSHRIGINGSPCDTCVIYNSCGGWNKAYAKAYNHDGLKSIIATPEHYQNRVLTRGGLFDSNPANKGYGAI